MNTYRFELEYNDGFIDTYETCGINLHMAHEMLMEYLMKYVRKELEHWNEGDADTTDLENIMRLKMPFLLRKAVNMEYFRQLF